MKRDLAIAVTVALLLACLGSAEEVPLVKQEGDVAAFVIAALAERGVSMADTNHQIHTVWRSRTVAGADASGQPCTECDILQLYVPKEHFAAVEALFKSSLGPPNVPLPATSQRMAGWSVPKASTGVMIMEYKDDCVIQIVGQNKERR